MANQATRSLDEAELPDPSRDQARRTTAEPQTVTAPHAGRTGGAGARAERPSEGTRKKSPAPQQPGRGGKAPSADDGGQPASGRRP
jgi:hypothetical protein